MLHTRTDRLPYNHLLRIIAILPHLSIAHLLRRASHAKSIPVPLRPESRVPVRGISTHAADWSSLRGVTACGKRFHGILSYVWPVQCSPARIERFEHGAEGWERCGHDGVVRFDFKPYEGCDCGNRIERSLGPIGDSRGVDGGGDDHAGTEISERALSEVGSDETHNNREAKDRRIVAL